MNLLNRLTVKSLKLNKKRTVVTVVGIMLSVALITAVASVYASGLQSLINYEMNEKGAFHVVFYNVPAEQAQALDSNRGVDTVNITQSIGYADIGSKNEDKPYVCVKGFTDSSLKNLSVKIVEGRLPENDGEILIPTHLKTNGRVALAVGDEVTLNVGKRVTADGYELNQQNPFQWADEEGTPAESVTGAVPKTYKIVGIIERPATKIEPYSAPGYTVITRLDGSELSGDTDVYVLYTKSGVKKAYKLTAGILGVDEDLFETFYSGRSQYYEDSVRLSDELESASYGFDINFYLITLQTDPLGVSLVYAVITVIAIIVVTSIFCIKNSFDIYITEKIRQYGMLRSIGATKKQIRKNVLFEASILGLFSIPLGIMLGFFASYVLIIISNLLVANTFAASFSLSFVFSWQAVIVAVLLGSVTIYFSTVRSAVKASRVSPIASVKNSAGIRSKSKKLTSPRLVKKLFGVGGEISYKNLKRNKSKYRTTVISIVVSVVIFISLSSFMKMAFDEVDREIERTDHNISVSAACMSAEEYQRLIDTTLLDNVSEFSIVRSAEISFTGNRYNKEYLDLLRLTQDEDETQYISVLSVGDRQFNKYCASLGIDPQSMTNKAVLCDYGTIQRYSEDGDGDLRYMRILNFEKGDTIDGYVENKLTNETAEAHIEIAAISDKKPFGLKGWGGTCLFVSDGFFDEMTGTADVDIFYMSDDADKLQDEIEARLQGISYKLTNIDENHRQTNNLYTLVGIFLYGFITVISLIGMTNIFNTVTTNMELRRPEFAMFRSVGMTNREFHRMIRLESLFIGTRALVIGVPVGSLLSYLIYRFLAAESGYPFKLPMSAIFISIAGVFLMIFLIMSYSIGKIKKQNTIETIRNENI